MEPIQATPGASWTWSRNDDERYDLGWHFHRECELNVITHGTGTRFVGDSAAAYHPGDAVLLGSELPHSWVSGPNGGRQRAVVVQFRADFLGPGFLELPEFTPLADLLARAGGGLVLPGWAAGPIAELPLAAPAAGTVALLALLVELSRADTLVPIATADYLRPRDGAGRRRVDDVIRYLHTNFQRDLTITDIAAYACMSPAGLSRLFRRCAGSTVTDHLNQVRIAAACRRLRDGDEQVAAIAADCGYRNLANFNRRFREITGTSPREFRRAAALEGSPGARRSLL
jgi:AraC-like DNA-binding protein